MHQKPSRVIKRDVMITDTSSERDLGASKHMYKNEARKEVILQLTLSQGNFSKGFFTHPHIKRA